MRRYVIAVKRDKREQASDTWLETLSTVEGVRILGEPNPRRTQVEAGPEAIEHLKALLADCCHIEELIDHRPL